jgi:adenylate cyclase
LLLVETEIAQAIATGIAGRLAPVQHRSLAARPTTSPEAYDHFLRGNFFLAGRDIARAVQEFEVALTVDPRFTQALARIAYGYGTLLDRGLTVNDLPAESLLVRGSAAVERALSLDSSASDAWMADGYIRAFRYPRTFEGVLPALERAITLDPRNTEAHHQYAWMLHLVGRDSAAEAENLRALELDPTRWITCQQLAVGYFTTRRFGEALRWADSAGALEANVYALIQQFWASFFVGDMGRARAAADSIRRVFGDPDLADLVAAVAGDTVARQSTLHYASELTRHTDLGSASDAALRYALLGQPELAIDALERVRSSGLWLWATTRVPGFDALRSNPRFQRLVEQIRPR